MKNPIRLVLITTIAIAARAQAQSDEQRWRRSNQRFEEIAAPAAMRLLNNNQSGQAPPVAKPKAVASAPTKDQVLDEPSRNAIAAFLGMSNEALHLLSINPALIKSSQAFKKFAETSSSLKSARVLPLETNPAQYKYIFQSPGLSLVIHETQVQRSASSGLIKTYEVENLSASERLYPNQGVALGPNTLQTLCALLNIDKAALSLTKPDQKIKVANLNDYGIYLGKIGSLESINVRKAADSAQYVLNGAINDYDPGVSLGDVTLTIDESTDPKNNGLKKYDLHLETPKPFRPENTGRQANSYCLPTRPARISAFKEKGPEIIYNRSPV